MYKKVAIVFLILSVFLIGGGIFLSNKEKKDKLKAEEKAIEIKKEQEKILLEQIKTSFNQHVKTNKEAKLYNYVDNKYEVVGTVGQNEELELENTEINLNTKYFKIKSLGYYISYKDVQRIEKLSDVNNRYKNYIVFNENIYTTSPTAFYDGDKKVYELNKSFEFPIIIKDTDKYYVEFNNRLLEIKASNVSKTEKKINTKEVPRDNIRTLTYHTIYNTKTEQCSNTVICHPIEQFDSHMKYLSENNYFTLTMDELEMFLDGKIQIPKKSIVITLDDGKYAINAVKIVEKYKVNATYFIITSRYNVKDIETTYMNFESHTHNLHNNYKCSGGNQGGELLCSSREKILNDLKTSQKELGGATAIAYPFFDFNNNAINVLKEAGFKLAFVGQYNTNGYSNKKTNRMIIPRKTIFSYDKIETFISYLK